MGKGMEGLKMKRCILSAGMAISILSLSFLFGGCCLIGLGIGSISDAHKPAVITTPSSQIQSVEPGKNVDMVLRDGTVLKGKYEGVQSVPEEEYATRYEETCAQNISLNALPRLGERVRVSFVGNNPPGVVECEFSGFDLGLIMVKAGKKNAVHGVSTKRYSTFENSEGKPIDLKAVDALMLEGKIPYMSAAVMRIGSDKRVISVDQISVVQTPNKRRGKLNGFLGGAFIDAVVIYLGVRTPMFSLK